jgi:hypothetical protein
MSTENGRDGWQETEAQTALATQILRDKQDYLEGGERDIGRRISASERELFVSCDPGEAMQQQFDHLHPSFIAVHDIATSSSRKLLAGIAAAAGGLVQHLVIRRQGYGTPLATIEFVDLPTQDGSSLRLYTTDCDADTASRQAIARVLMSYSRLAVVMVGELPPHAIDAAFRPLHDDLLSGGWRNHEMLLLPLASASAVAKQGAEIVRGTSVNLRTTPQVTRPADAWNFINGTWSRLAEPVPPGAASARPSPPPPAPRPPVEPLGMRPMPAVPTAAAARAEPVVGGPGMLLERYVQKLCELTGMVGACVFDFATGRVVAHAGSGPPASELATQGAEILSSLIATSRTMGFGHAIPEAAITLGSHHLVLRPVPRHAGLALHAVLDKAQANLTLARLQVQRLDSVLEESEAA